MQKKSKISIFIIGLVIVLTSIGLSYAYWKTTIMGAKGNNVTSGCFNVEMINQKDEITLGSTFPITDAEGLKLKPFSFTLKNTCTIFAHYYVNMEMLEGTTLNSKFVAVRVNNEAINTLDTYKVANTTINTSTESRTISEGYLGADEEVDYTVSFWMDEDATIDDDVMNKVFKSKIVINSEPGKYDPVSAGYDTLHDAILANEYQTTPEIAKTKIANKQEVDLSQTAPIIKWVEKTGESTIQQVVKPTAEAISSVSELSNLNSNEQYMNICTTKTFDSTSGRYLLSDCSLKDPTTLKYTGDEGFYYSSEYMALNQTTSKFFVTRNDADAKIYKIISATKTTDTKATAGISYDANIYSLSCISLEESELESDNSDKGLYQTIDDYGTTYYYRGNVKNNNVYFAGFYWQIVRINGDGTIRLMYNGTKKNSTGSEKSSDHSSFNISTASPSYVGYMYGNYSAINYDEVHANINDSNVKSKADSWYKSNIIDKGYSSFVSSATGFCGDRTLITGNGVHSDTNTEFGALKRMYDNTATLVCLNQQNDLYTTSVADIGNAALIYPIGLITYDELVFSGLNSNKLNKLAWTYSSENYWTMTPSSFSASWKVPYEMIQNSTGYISSWWEVTFDFNIRPVINLKSDVKITGGTGTANDPFVVDTNN